MQKGGNAYEEARRLRVQENLKQLEGFGLSKISKSLLEVAKCEHKLLKSSPSPKPKKNLEMIELRRSSRARNLISTYADDVHHDDGMDRRSYRKRYPRSGSNRDYTGRIASYQEEVWAVEKAEKLQSSLKSDHPSFVKSMVRSHVSSCFWLGLPSSFCKEHLPPRELKMVLEDEEGVEYDAIYIGSRTGLSGGWRGFAMDHNLEDGDVLLFELSEPDRFKIHIIKAIEEQPKDENEAIDAADIKANAALAIKNESVEEEDDETPVSGSVRRSKRAAK